MKNPEFFNSLIVSPYLDGKTWYLYKSLSYDSSITNETITVPVGFTTDFASVPRMFWWLLPKWGIYGNAAVLHDYLYSYQPYSKKISDDIFNEAMTVLNTPKWQQYILYNGVKIFGGFVWEKNKLKSKFKLIKWCDHAPSVTSEPDHWSNSTLEILQKR